MKILRASTYKRMPWKNGGGETVEIAVFPKKASLADFDWRVSMATVASNGPFSSFPGIDRTLSILQGKGMRLMIEGREPIVMTGETAPLPFPADVATSATLVTQGYTEAPHVSLTDEVYKIVVSRLGERLRIAGTAEFAGYDTGLNMVRCAALVKRAQALFPRAADYSHPVYWAGLRPATPSNCPLIGRTARCSNLYLNTGHGTLGWTEACGSGRALADIVSGKPPEVEYHFLGTERHRTAAQRRATAPDLASRR